MDYFFGGIGKDKSWILVAETPFVVFLEKEKEFIAVKSLQELRPHHETINKIYALNGGTWEELDFLAFIDRPSAAIGFSSTKANAKPN